MGLYPKGIGGSDQNRPKWHRFSPALTFKKLSKHSHLTNPTIEVRSSQLGIKPGELQRRIDNLPEPLRVIAMDYCHGALPPAGRSSAMRGILRDIIERLKGGEDDIEARRRAA
jgi:hypothetical protein